MCSFALACRHGGSGYDTGRAVGRSIEIERRMLLLVMREQRRRRVVQRRLHCAVGVWVSSEVVVVVVKKERNGAVYLGDSAKREDSRLGRRCRTVAATPYGTLICCLAGRWPTTLDLRTLMLTTTAYKRYPRFKCSKSSLLISTKLRNPAQFYRHSSRLSSFN